MDPQHCFEALSLTQSHVAERSVRRAAAIQMSTAVGSIAENTGGGLYAYRWDIRAVKRCASIRSRSTVLVQFLVLKVRLFVNSEFFGLKN
jgi:hypothetical protein